MAFNARVLADHTNPVGCRLVTFELTYPRFVHAEFMTHRVFSRNAGSSRAIPFTKTRARVLVDPAMPIEFGRNQKGMQAGAALSDELATEAVKIWLDARDDAVRHATRLHELGVHKQHVNRLTEPFQYITVICSATEFANFFDLRCHPDAQPEIKRIAEMTRDLYFASKSLQVPSGYWHMPFVQAEDWHALYQQGLTTDDQRLPLLKKFSVARCARVSYLTHDGEINRERDVERHDSLLASKHWSPFEHVAVATADEAWSGNFQGFVQYRKTFAHEHGRRKLLAAA